MKILLYSNHAWTEKSFSFLLTQLNRAKGFKFTEIKRVPAPTVIPPFIPQSSGYNHPDWKWFYTTLTKPHEKDYDLIIWHEERRRGQLLQNGAKKRYNGVYDSQTDDTVFNAVVFADNIARDEKTKNHHRLYPNLTDFERVFLHEVSHGASRFNNGADHTHIWDYDYHNIPAYFGTFDLTQYINKRTEIGLWQQILGITKKLNFLKKKPRLVHPLADFRITQAYGVPNPIYKVTKHHIGVDYATPIGTAIEAPTNGEVIYAGQLPAIGNYCLYRFTWNGLEYHMRVGHLQSIPTTGKYKTGDTFAISGNSGMSTGPHVHLDLWHRGFDLSVINSKNFREWTLDFEAWYNKNRHPL